MYDDVTQEYNPLYLDAVVSILPTPSAGTRSIRTQIPVIVMALRLKARRTMRSCSMTCTT